MPQAAQTPRAVDAAPRWRREPHRLLFPLGAALGVVAVLPFVFGGSGGGATALFHSVAQIQGFLTCFVAGFLMTLVPRLTRTVPAATFEVGSALALPTLAVMFSWLGESALAAWVWLLMLALVFGFTQARIRVRHPRVQLVPILLWVPASLAAGAVGAILIAGGPWLALSHAQELWAVGRGLLVQGFVSGLVLGIGGYLLPRVTRGEPPVTVTEPVVRRRALLMHGAAAAIFFGSFVLEPVVGARVGFGVRAVVAAAVLVGAARIHRPPSVRGLQLRLMWLAAWLVPAAFLLGAVAPRFRGAALHVLFVGGFAQITLAVSAHLVFGAGREATIPRRSVALGVMALFLAAAFVARIVAAVDVSRVAEWLRAAAFAFTAAVGAWAFVVGPRLVARSDA